MKTLLHVGCGGSYLENLPEIFHEGWAEIRLDIDPDAQPDILADITDMGALFNGCVDAVLCAHILEHLYSHQVPTALRESYRVLKPGGHFFVTLPDIQAVALELVKGRLEDPLFESALGPICAIDILYGHRESLEKGRAAMAHKTAFTAETLQWKLEETGFKILDLHRDERYALWASAQKPEAK